MPLETGQATRKSIATRITTDETMISVFSHDSLVWLYDIEADSNPGMPYMVDRLMVNGIFVGTHDYYLDLYDYNLDGNPARIGLALDQLKILLHGWQITTAEDEIGGGVMEARDYGWGWIPTGDSKVMHYATHWAVRFGATRDITNILA